MSFTVSSFKDERPLTFNNELIVILSDVILLASKSCNPVEDEPQQSI